MSESAKELLLLMPTAFDPEAAKDENAVIQYRLTGPDGGDWYMVVEKGTLELREGVAEAAEASMTIGADDFVKLAYGQLNPMLAMLTGKIKASGNMGLLMKMQSWFRR